MKMYRLLLRLLPRHRRLAYGDEMREVFSMVMLASRVRGTRWKASLWIREVIGMVKFAWRERFGPRNGRGRFTGTELHWAWRSVRGRGWAGVFSVALLALAIAANGIVFAAVDALAINRTPYPDVDRIVTVVNAAQRNQGPFLGVADGRRLLEHSALFHHAAAYARSTLFLQGNGFSERVSVVNATPGLFAVLGVAPRWGRTFSADDVRIHNSDVVVISEGLARSRFGTPASAVGKTLDTTDVPLRVVGVMPGSFRFPDGLVEVWRGLDDEGPLAANTFSLAFVARMKDGQSPAETSDALRLRLGADASESKFVPDVERFDRGGRDRTRFFALLGAALCLLLTACANAASLELVAAFGRVRSYAIQRALGASRWMLARVVLLEGAILIGFAVLAGGALATLGLDALVAELPRSYGLIPANPIDLDARAVIFMGAAAAATWLMTAVPVLFFATGVNLLDVLKHGGQSHSESRVASFFRQALTAAQVAIAVVLLVGGLLYAQTYLARVSVDKGFDSTGLASLALIIPPQQIGQTGAISRSLIERLRTHPGVLGITGDSAPPSGDSPNQVDNIEIDGAQVPTPELRVARRLASATFLPLIGAPLRAGRFLQDDDPAVNVIVSEPFARRFWPGGAIGRTFRLSPQAPARTIVGVVPHIRSDEDRYVEESGLTLVFYERPVPRVGPPRPAPAPPAGGRRIPAVASGFAPLTLKLDSKNRLPEVVAAVRRDVPQFAVNAAMVDDTYRGWEAESKLQTTVVTAFGVLAFITALIGLYGVMMFLVAGRTREIGVRMALGASRRHVVALVLQSASRMSAAGAVLGLLIAFGLSRYVESQLFGVSAADTATYIGVAAVVGAGAALATWFPARRATNVDPAVTLRSE